MRTLINDLGDRADRIASAGHALIEKIPLARRIAVLNKLGISNEISRDALPPPVEKPGQLAQLSDAPPPKPTEADAAYLASGRTVTRLPTAAVAPETAVIPAEDAKAIAAHGVERAAAPAAPAALGPMQFGKGKSRTALVGRRVRAGSSASAESKRARKVNDALVTNEGAKP